MKPSPSNLLAALSLSTIATIALTGPCGGAEITSDVAPPPARIERFEPRDGYIWARGHWEWSGHSYNWVSGTYLMERRNFHWIPDQWEQVGSRWRYVAGHWEH